MKRFGNLWQQVTSLDNLLLAARKAQRGKRFYEDVAAFNFNIERELLLLQQELSCKGYLPGPHRTFAIIEPKPRLISAAPYRDRVVHHALCNVIEPIFDRTFISDSYACRSGRGTHAAVDRLTQFLRRSHYVLKCDIRKYFPSIDHGILKEMIRRKIKCPDTLWLSDLIIDHGGGHEEAAFLFPGDDLFTTCERRRGLPIGNLTSQLFANLYLSGFDHWMKETRRIDCYIRYMDDFVVTGETKAMLHELRDAAAEYLISLRLKLHEKKCRVFPVSCGTEFLGYTVFRDHRRLRAANLSLLRKRMRQFQHDYATRAIELDRVEASVRSWIAHASHADTWGLRKDVLQRYVFVRGQVENRSRVIRGGSWNNSASNVETGYRNNNTPSNVNNNNGFRCASTPICRSLAE